MAKSALLEPISTLKRVKSDPILWPIKADVWSKQTKFNGSIGIIGSETTLLIGAVWGHNYAKLTSEQN